MMDVREFISKLKDEVRDYLPDDVYKDIVIDDVTVVKMLTDGSPDATRKRQYHR